MTTTSGIDQVEAFDFGFLRELQAAGRASGADLVGESLRLFLDSTAPRLDVLATALGRGDRETASLAAHTLRGGCAQFGALRLARLAGEIEGQVLTGGPPPSAHAVAELRSEFAMVRAALLHEFGPPGAAR